MYEGRLPKADGRLTPTVVRALELYRRLGGYEPTSTRAVLAMSPARLKRWRRLEALLGVELEAMTRRELANYYARIRDL